MPLYECEHDDHLWVFEIHKDNADLIIKGGKVDFILRHSKDCCCSVEITRLVSQKYMCKARRKKRKDL
jgi:hypothetical protein